MNTKTTSTRATKTLSALALGLSLTLTSQFANAGHDTSAMDPYIESALIDVCKSTLTDRTYKMRKTIEGYNLNTKTVAMKVMCNGANISDFAAQNGALKTSSYLERSLGDVSISDVASNSNEKLSVYFTVK